MSQKISYKDAVMKNSDKTFEISKKVNHYEYARRDIRKLCTSGDLEQLKKIPVKSFNEETKTFLVKNMKDKIAEIETWKYEDHNQLSGKLEELDLRIEGINRCLEYVENLSLLH